MRRHAITYATSANIAAARLRWVKALETAWPVAGAVEFRATGLDQLVATMESKPPAIGSPACALVVFGPGETNATIDRTVEALLNANIGAVCLMDNPDTWRPFQRQGIIFDGSDAAPEIVAAMLYALAERQPAVDVLAREIVLVQRCQGGIRQEMDRIHEELHLAAAIQREFTSAALPQVDGLDLGVVFRPVNFVSGDIYNVRPLGPGRAAFFV